MSLDEALQELHYELVELVGRKVFRNLKIRYP